MQQFFAILKDSFREAVDGFVIYAMLVMSALVIALLGSLSFSPSEPKEAFDNIVRHFADGFVEGGRMRGIHQQNAQFGSEDVRAEGTGYKLRVVVTGQNRVNFNDGPERPDGPDKLKKDPERLKGDGFRDLAQFLFKTFFGLEVKGLENLPKPGQRAVITPNHTSNL